MEAQPTRKIRPDAQLRQLPEERQAAIYADLEKRTYAQVRKSLAADGVVCGPSALADFFHAYSTEQRFRRAEVQRVETVKEMKARHPEMALEEVEAFGDAIFLTAATAENDLAGYVKVRRITEGAKRTRLESRRIAMLEAKAAQLDKLEATLKDASLTTEQRQAKMREVFGITS